MKTGEWWHEFFPAFRPVFGLMSQSETNIQVRYLIAKLGLKRGHRFLDCPCGIGRVSLPLARQGIRVTGVDITESYLEELRAKAKRARLSVETVHADMRRIKFENRFDAGGNLWTSFGYFEKESDHLLTLKRMYRALKPGGRFVLQTINRDWIIANFQPRGWFDLGEGRILEERALNYERSIIKSKWHFINDGNVQTCEASMRVWSLHEMLELFRRVGFVELSTSGSEKDDPVSLAQRMMWVFGTKPK